MERNTSPFDLPEGDCPLLNMLREQGSMSAWIAMTCCDEFPLVLGRIEGAETYLCPVCHTLYGNDMKPRGNAFAGHPRAS